MPIKLTNSKINLVEERDVKFKPELNSMAVNKYKETLTMADGTKKEIDPFIRGISESRAFRMFGSHNFFIFSCNRKSSRAKVQQILSEGVIMEGKRWFPVINSAAELRGQKGLFTCLDRKTVIDQITFGANFADENDMVTMSKKVAYTGLGSSTTKEVNIKFDYVVVPDVVRTVDLEVETFNPETGLFDRDTIAVTQTYSDGAGYITLEKAIEIAKQRKLNYIPSAFQIRFAGEKGLLLVWNWDKSVYNADIIFHKSMHKFDIDPSFDHNADHERDELGNITKYMPRLEICGHTKPTKSTHAFLCYQFIQAMEFSFDDLKSMVDDAVTKVYGVLQEPAKAKLFLGMMASSSDIEDDNDQETLVTNLSKVISADENMLFDPYIQKRLKSLLEKYVLDMRKGRIPVFGNYQYVFSDPQAFFGAPMLQAGQSFFNNVQDCGIALRPPLIHKSEVNKLNFCTLEQINAPDFMSKVYSINGFVDFAYGQDIILLNTFEDHLKRAGGADTDGDKKFLTFDKLFIDRYVKYPLVNFDGMSGKKVEDTHFNYISFLLDAYCSESKIGEYVNYSTVWKDLPYNLPQYSAQADYAVKRLSIDVVMEIDSAKTGYRPIIDKNLKCQSYPHWMELNIGKSEEYRSVSPLGRTYDYVITTWDAIKNSVLGSSKTFKKSLDFLKLVDGAVYNNLLNITTIYDKNYRKEMASISEMQNNDYISEEVANMKRFDIIQNYKDLVASLDGDLVTVAIACYQATYVNRQGGSSSYSFPWVTAFDGLLQAISETSTRRTRLYPVKVNSINVDITESTQLCFIDGVDEINSCSVSKLVPDGVYTPFEYYGNLYIEIANDDKLVVTSNEPAITDKVIQFSIRGFGNYGLKGPQVLDILKNSASIYCRAGEQYITVYAETTDGITPIASVAKDDDYTVAKIQNMQLVVKNLDSLEPTYWSKRNNRFQNSGNFMLICSFAGAVDFDDTESQDVTSLLAEKGIEVVGNRLHEEPNIYALDVIYNGDSSKTYAIYYQVVDAKVTILTNIKSDEIRNLFIDYVVASLS